MSTDVVFRKQGMVTRRRVMYAIGQILCFVTILNQSDIGNIWVAIQCYQEPGSAKSVLPCRGIRDICSNFNLTDELSTVAASLKMEAKKLTSSKARADADATIVDLLGFIDKLSSEKPAASQKGEHQPPLECLS